MLQLMLSPLDGAVVILNQLWMKAEGQLSPQWLRWTLHLYKQGLSLSFKQSLNGSFRVDVTL